MRRKNTTRMAIAKLFALYANAIKIYFEIRQ